MAMQVEAARALIYASARHTNRLEIDYANVSGLLPDIALPATIQANILPGWGLPSMTLGEAELTQWSENLSFDYDVHLLIHILTGYEQSQFLEEGLAVYGTEVLVPTSSAEAWWRLYRNHPPAVVLGLDSSDIDRAWVAAAQARYPNPLPCQVALRLVGLREGFWCALTEGR